ncbi:CLUMA_CG006013, isoform A [Clunio marinus]|uniref:CLUMA_CG006013, isoform A n=1 Tax=Clunio marinus TaxID=568069 RepID=A0A1J1I0T5_9DIPT|nr:CLUMA_CG006013, isoform A [Clunio marinus]
MLRFKRKQNESFVAKPSQTQHLGIKLASSCLQISYSSLYLYDESNENLCSKHFCKSDERGNRIKKQRNYVGKI